eukprot:COSAG01_NODE_6271_length_3755_cov_5.711633_4_plen_172_part_00
MELRRTGRGDTSAAPAAQAPKPPPPPPHMAAVVALATATGTDAELVRVVRLGPSEFIGRSVQPGLVGVMPLVDGGGGGGVDVMHCSTERAAMIKHELGHGDLLKATPQCSAAWSVAFPPLRPAPRLPDPAEWPSGPKPHNITATYKNTNTKRRHNQELDGLRLMVFLYRTL